MRHARRGLAALLAALIAVAALPGQTVAQDAEVRTEQAIQMLLEQGRWQEAVDELTLVVAAGQLTGRRLSRARKFLALGHIFLGEDAEAVAVYRDLARQDPNFMMDDLAIGDSEPSEDAVRLFGQAVVEVRLEEREEYAAQLLQTSHSGAMLRSLMLPGWGQRYQGYRNRGLMLMGLTGGSIAYAVLAELSYRDARDAYDGARTGADFPALYQDYRDKAGYADLAFGAVCGLWLVNVLDAAIQGPNTTRRQVSMMPLPNRDGLRVVLLTDF